MLVVHAIWVLTVRFGGFDLTVVKDQACWCIGWDVDHWIGGKRTTVEGDGEGTRYLRGMCYKCIRRMGKVLWLFCSVSSSFSAMQASFAINFSMPISPLF